MAKPQNHGQSSNFVVGESYVQKREPGVIAERSPMKRSSITDSNNHQRFSHVDNNNHHGGFSHSQVNHQEKYRVSNVNNPHTSQYSSGTRQS